jgi:hypothetical protein
MTNRIPKVCTDLHPGMKRATLRASPWMPRRPLILSRAVVGTVASQTIDRELLSIMTKKARAAS